MIIWVAEVIFFFFYPFLLLLSFLFTTCIIIFATKIIILIFSFNSLLLLSSLLWFYFIFRIINKRISWIILPNTAVFFRHGFLFFHSSLPCYCWFLTSIRFFLKSKWLTFIQPTNSLTFNKSSYLFYFLFPSRLLWFHNKLWTFWLRLSWSFLWFWLFLFFLPTLKFQSILKELQSLLIPFHPFLIRLQ